MKNKITLAQELALHVVAMTIGGRTVYLAQEGATWDGSWFTAEISEAKRYKLARNAQRRISEQGVGANSWEPFAPRVTTVGAA